MASSTFQIASVWDQHANNRSCIVCVTPEVLKSRCLELATYPRPSTLDEAMISRFTQVLHVPLPNHEDRADMLQSLVHDYQHCIEKNDWKCLSESLEVSCSAPIGIWCSSGQMRSCKMELQVKDVNTSSGWPRTSALGAPLHCSGQSSWR